MPPFFMESSLNRIMQLDRAEAWSIDRMLHLFWLIYDWRAEWRWLGVTHI